MACKQHQSDTDQKGNPSPSLRMEPEMNTAGVSTPVHNFVDGLGGCPHVPSPIGSEVPPVEYRVEILEQQQPVPPAVDEEMNDEAFRDSLYLGLSYRSANPDALMLLVPEVYTSDEIDRKVGETFGPIVLAVHPVHSQTEWFTKALETRFDTAIEIDLTPVERPAPGENQAYEAVIVLETLTERGATHLKKGWIKFKQGPICGLLMPPRSCKHWIPGTLLLRMVVPAEGVMPLRETMFSVAREAVAEALKTNRGEVWVSEQGWFLRGTDSKYDATGMTPFCAYHMWKQVQRDIGAYQTEHSSHPIWSIRDSGTVTSSYSGGRVDKQYRNKPLENAMEIRFPISMTEMFTAQLSHTIPRRLRVELQVMEPVYPRTALRILEGAEIQRDETKRVYLMRIVALPELEGGAKWAHPRQIIQYLLDQGLNVGGVYTENTIMEVNGLQPQCVSVSKVLMGRVGETTPSSMALIVKASGSATASPWQPQSTYAPRMGYDLFAYDGGMHFRPAVVKATHDVRTDSIISKAMSAVRERAVAEGMTNDSHHEASLIEAIADLRKESLVQETQAVRAQLEALKRESKMNCTEQQVSNTFTVIFERRDTGEDEVIKVRLTKLERYQQSAGIGDLIGYLMYEEIIPKTLFIPESDFSAFRTKFRAAEGAPPSSSIPVIASVTIEGDKDYLPERRVKRLVMKDIWEDQDTLRIGVRLVESEEEMKWASSWISASEEGNAKRQAPEGGGGEGERPRKKSPYPKTDFAQAWEGEDDEMDPDL